MANKRKRKASVHFAIVISEREDGGIVITSPHIPGFRLSASNKDAVFHDLGPVLQTMLHHNHKILWLKDE